MEPKFEETLRRFKVAERAFVDGMRLEGSLLPEFCEELIARWGPDTFSSEPPIVNLPDYYDFFGYNTNNIQKINSDIFQGLLKKINNPDKIKSDLNENLVQDFNKDNYNILIEELTVTTYFVRNRALWNLFGEKEGTDIEVMAFNLVMDNFGQRGGSLYNELHRLWIGINTEMIIPHRVFSQGIIKRSLERTGTQGSNFIMIGELVFSFIIMETFLGIWKHVKEKMTILPN